MVETETEVTAEAATGTEVGTGAVALVAAVEGGEEGLETGGAAAGLEEGADMEVVQVMEGVEAAARFIRGLTSFYKNY